MKIPEFSEVHTAMGEAHAAFTKAEDDRDLLRLIVEATVVYLRDDKPDVTKALGVLTVLVGGAEERLKESA